MTALRHLIRLLHAIKRALHIAKIACAAFQKIDAIIQASEAKPEIKAASAAAAGACASFLEALRVYKESFD